MSNLPPDSRALRQIIYVGLLSFVVGLFAVLAAMGWLIARFVAPDGRWWDILLVSINAIDIAVFGGLCFSAAALWVLGRVHYRRGVFRCRFCGRPLKSMGALCDCPEARALRT